MGERLNGHTSKSAKSRSKANMSIASNALLGAQEHNLSYVLKITTPLDGFSGDSDSEEEGEEEVARKFAVATCIKYLLRTAKQPNVVDTLRRDESESDPDADAEPPKEVVLSDVVAIKKKKDFGRGPRDCHKKWLIANREFPFADRLPKNDELGLIRWKSCTITRAPRHKFSGPDIVTKVTGSVDPHANILSKPRRDVDTREVLLEKQLLFQRLFLKPHNSPLVSTELANNNAP